MRCSEISILTAVAALWGCTSDGPATGAVPAAASQGGATIHVGTAPVRAGSMQRALTLHGSVAPIDSSVRAYSLPFEVELVGLRVSAGERVEADQSLFESRRTSATAVAAQTATEMQREARLRLEQVQARQADGLATREEVIKANGALRRAEQQVAAMRHAGQLSVEHGTRAVRSGVVAFVGAQVGALLAAGTPVLGLTEDQSIGVELWAEPGDASALALDMPVTIEPLQADRKAPMDGRIQRVDGRVDPTTRLVRVLVALDDPRSVLLGQRMRGRVALGGLEGFIVPRAALVAFEGAFRVYTVEDGHARAHAVDVLVESNDEVLVRGAGLDTRHAVITRGAYQAEDGMRVEPLP